MELEDLKEHYVTFANAMRKCGFSCHAYLQWRRFGYIPYHAQLKIEEKSQGALKADGVNRYKLRHQRMRDEQDAKG